MGFSVYGKIKRTTFMHNISTNLPLKHCLRGHFLKSPVIKGNTKFWYGVMNLVQINILEAYICDPTILSDRCRGCN